MNLGKMFKKNDGYVTVKGQDSKPEVPDGLLKTDASNSAVQEWERARLQKVETLSLHISSRTSSLSSSGRCQRVETPVSSTLQKR